SRSDGSAGAENGGSEDERDGGLAETAERPVHGLGRVLEHETGHGGDDHAGEPDRARGNRLGRHPPDDRGKEGEVVPRLRPEALGHREQGDDPAHQERRRSAEEKGSALWSHPARPPRERRRASTSARSGSESCAPRFVHARAAAALARGIACSSEPPAASPTARAPLKASPAAVESTASTGKEGK